VGFGGAALALVALGGYLLWRRFGRQSPQ
jgi:hypothetical protein